MQASATLPLVESFFAASAIRNQLHISEIHPTVELCTEPLVWTPLIPAFGHDRLRLHVFVSAMVPANANGHKILQTLAAIKI